VAEIWDVYYIGWDESGKVILQVSITVFSGVVEIFFRAKMAQPLPLEKNRPVRLLVVRRFT